MPLDKIDTYLSFVNCSHHENYYISFSKELLNESRAVIFHARDIDYNNLMLINKGRPKEQVWILVSSESPINTYPKPNKLDNLFNITIHYNSKSEIVNPYGKYLNRTQPINVSDVDKMMKGVCLSKKKSKITWIVSNCHLDWRNKLTKILQEHFEVVVYGKCSNLFVNQGGKCDPFTIECQEKLKDSKFYLSFENGFCDEYITEKYWNHPMVVDMIPLVIGGANYTDLVLEESFINVLQFKNINDLITTIKSIDESCDEWIKYFRWKAKYELWNPIYGGWPYVSDWICKICELLYNSSFSNISPTSKIINEKQCRSSPEWMIEMIEKAHFDLFNSDVF